MKFDDAKECTFMPNCGTNISKQQKLFLKRNFDWYDKFFR